MRNALQETNLMHLHDLQPFTKSIKENETEESNFGQFQREVERLKNTESLANKEHH
jgi:hypothetical protein